MRIIAAQFLLIALTCAFTSAQTGGGIASTVVYTKQAPVDTYTASHPGATFVKADAAGLTFKKANGRYTLLSAPGLTYKQDGNWLPTKLKVATASDGSGWLIQGASINATLTGSKNKDKDLSISSGSVTFNLHLPQLSHNGDNTFAFQEGGTQWRLRVEEANVSIEATVAKRLGKGAARHSFGYQSAGSAAKLASDKGGGVDVGSEVYVTRPVVVGANQKLYYVCTPWSTDASTMSFSCDDSALPDAAFPYVIDPTWTTPNQSWYWNPSPWSYSQSSGAMGQQMTGYFNWQAQYYYNLPNNAQITSESVNTSGLSVDVQPDPNLYPSTCTNQFMNAGNGWVTISFQLSYSGDGQTHGCIATVNGTQSLSATVEYWVPEISTPGTPSGPANGFTGSSYSYSTGADTTSGQATQYLFNWGDGSNTGWLSASSASHTWNSVGTYTVTAQARDSYFNDVMATSAGKTVVIGLPETISAPTTLTGEANPLTGTPYTYTTGGSASSFGNNTVYPVQYRFHWGDGSDTGWLPVGTAAASKTWGSAWSYTVSAEAQTASSHVLSAPRTMVVNTSIPTYQLTGIPSPNGWGYIQTNPQGLYNAGTQVTVTAVPFAGYYFIGFTGDLTGTANPQTITMNGPKTITANFGNGFLMTAYPPDQTVNVGGSAIFTVNLEPTSGFSGPVSLSATCDSGLTPTFDSTLVSLPTDPPAHMTLNTASINSFDSTTCTINGISGSRMTHTPVVLRLDRVVVSTDPAGVGLTVIGDNNPPWPAPYQPHTWLLGSTHTIAVGTQQTGTDGVTYQFAQWSDGVTANPRTITVNPTANFYTAKFTASTYTISGTVRLGGVGLNGIDLFLSGFRSASTTTDSAGNYSFAGLAGSHDYTVRPSFYNYTFSPTERTINNLNADVTGASFDATGGSGVTVGTPVPEEDLPLPVFTQPQPQSNSLVACADLSGTWSDPNLVDPNGGPGTWSLSSGSTVSGTLDLISTGADGTCSPAQVRYNVSGFPIGNVRRLTATNPTPPTRTCGSQTWVEPTTISVDVSGVDCSLATPAGYTFTRPPGTQAHVRPAEGSAVTRWTRTSTAPGITLTTDIYNDAITVLIAGQNKSGDLKVAMSGVLSMGSQGPVQPVTLAQVSNASPGNRPFHFNRTKLPAPVSFDQVTATWADLSVSTTAGFTTLGPTRFSQYNSPAEGPSCGGTPATAFVFRPGTCTYDLYKNEIDSVFVTQTTLNGTGRSARYGLLKALRASALFKACDWPEGSNHDPRTGNVFVAVSDVRGSCGTKFVAGNTVAVNPNPKNDSTGQWNCSDHVLILDSGNSINATMPVQDLCPACSGDFRGASGHIDVFTSSESCSPRNAQDYPNSPLFGIKLR